MDKNLSYLRIAGYFTTVALHAVVISAISFNQKPSTDERILEFLSNRPRYLTGWNVVLQVVHALLGLQCEYLLLNNSANKQYSLPKLLKGTRDKLFTNIVFPGSLLVSTVFWTLFTYNREIVYPTFLDQIIPLTYNHILHTAIVPLALYEIFVQPRYEPKSHVFNYAHITLHCLLYIAVVIYTYFEKGQWLYPIMAMMSPLQFVGFCVSIIGLGFAYYFLHWRLVRLVWGTESPSIGRSKARKIK